MTVQGIVATSAFGGLEVLDIEYGPEDRVVYRWCIDGKEGRICRAKIRDDVGGLPYFKTRGQTVFMGDVLAAL